MDFTITANHIISLLWILIGVGFTLIGIVFTEWIKDNRENKKLTKAFRTEVSNNLRKAKYNLDLIDNFRKKSRQIFHTVAYEQLKLAVILDSEESDLCNSIFRGYSLAEEYNLSINHPQDYEQRKSWEKASLEVIRKEMNKIHEIIKNYKNIEKALNSKN